MGRARGRQEAIATDHFAAVFGTRRGRLGMDALLELSPLPSSAGQELLQEHRQRLERGELEPTLALLAEHGSEIARYPRLQDLRALLRDRLHREVTTECAEQLTASQAKLGLEAPPINGHLSLLGAVISSLPLTTEITAADARANAAEGYRKQALKLLLDRVVKSPEPTIAHVLGKKTYLRLAAEANGWWPTEKLADLVPGDFPTGSGELERQEKAQAVPLAPFLERKHWRALLVALLADVWNPGAAAEQDSATPPEREKANYRLARLLRKRIQIAQHAAV